MSGRRHISGMLDDWGKGSVRTSAGLGQLGEPQCGVITWYRLERDI